MSKIDFNLCIFPKTVWFVRIPTVHNFPTSKSCMDTRKAILHRHNKYGGLQ